jgi:hypothetical protein
VNRLPRFVVKTSGVSRRLGIDRNASRAGGGRITTRVRPFFGGFTCPGRVQTPANLDALVCHVFALEREGLGGDSPGLGGYAIGYSTAPTQMPFESYRLSASDATDLVELWRRLRSRAVTDQRFLTTALRRFAFAGERTRAEDRILDLMIAAEASLRRRLKARSRTSWRSTQPSSSAAQALRSNTSSRS